MNFNLSKKLMIFNINKDLVRKENENKKYIKIIFSIFIFIFLLKVVWELI